MTVTLNVGDLVTVGGVTYVVGITLLPQSGAPVPTPVPVPVPTPVPTPLPTPVPQPTVNEFRDATRQAATNKITGGGTFWIYGGNFGAAPGTLTVNAAPLLVLSWSDQWIEFVAPPAVAGASVGMWQIKRADATSASGWYSFSGPAIQAPSPAAGLDRERQADHPPTGKGG